MFLCTLYRVRLPREAAGDDGGGWGYGTVCINTLYVRNIEYSAVREYLGFQVTLPLVQVLERFSACVKKQQAKGNFPTCGGKSS